MKKQILFLLLVFIIVAFFLVEYKHSKAFQRAKFESLVKQKSGKLPHSNFKEDKDR